MIKAKYVVGVDSGVAVGGEIIASHLRSNSHKEYETNSLCLNKLPGLNDSTTPHTLSWPLIVG